MKTKLASELADTFIYLDLLAQAAGIDLSRAVAQTFDAKSEQIGYAKRVTNLSDQKFESARDLLLRAGVYSETVAKMDDAQLLICLEAVIEMLEEKPAPDVNWAKDYFKLTGDWMVLTDEGWIPGEMNTPEATGEEPCEIHDEVNAPVPS